MNDRDDDRPLADLLDVAGQADCLVVVGERGSGRTHLAESLVRWLSDQGWAAACLSLKAATGREALRAALADAVGGDAGTGIDAVLDGLAGPRPQGCLIIDDAGYLTVFALQSLLEARSRSAPSLRVVLLSDPATLTVWRSSPSLRGYSIASSDIPRLSDAEAREIVETLKADHPLDERVIGRIVRSARGLPGPLCEATRTALTNEALGRPATAMRPRRARFVTAGVVALVLVAVAGGWYARHAVPPMARAPAVASVQPVAPSGPAPSADASSDADPADLAPAKAVPDEASGPLPGPAVTAELASPAQDTVEASGPAVQPAGPASAQAGDPTTAAVPRSSPAGDAATPEAGRLATAQIGDDGPAQNGPAVAASAHPVRGGHGPARDDWLSRQPDSAYTIQLVSFKTATEAGSYIRRRVGAKGTAAVIETRHRGRPLYLVVYGSYPDRKAAHKAVSALPRALRRYQPWIRRIATLRRIERRSGAGSGP